MVHRRAVGLFKLGSGIVEGDGELLLSGGGGFEHGVHHDGFDNGAEAAGTELVVDGLVDNVVEHFGGEGKLDAVEGEEFDVLLDDGVFGFSEDTAQGGAVERFEVGEDRQTADDLGDETERLEVLGLDVLHEVGGVDFLEVLHGVVAYGVGVETLCDFLFDTVEGAAADEEDVVGIDVDVVLVGVLASALGGDVDDAAFEEFEHALLHTFSADVAGDGGVVALAGDFVDFVDEDDASLGFGDIEVGHLEESGEDALNVFAHVASFGEDGGVDDGEGDFEELGDGAGEESLSGAGGAYHDDVALLDFDAVVFGGAEASDALVVVVDGYGEVALGGILSDDVLVEVFFDFFGGGEGAEVFDGCGSGLGECFVGNAFGLFGAVVADEAVDAGDEHPHVARSASAEGAVVFVVCSFCHIGERLFAVQNAVDHAIFTGFFGRHPVVAVAVGPNFVKVGMAMLSNNGIEFLFEFHNFTGRDFDVGSLALCTAEGLVDHDAAVGEGRTFAFLAGDEKNGGHRGGHACADGGNVALDELHGVVDAEAGVDAAAGTVDVDGDVLAGVGAVEVEELGLESVGGVVINLRAEEDDAVHHEAAEHVHLGDVELSLFEDVWVEVLVLRGHDIVQHEGADAHL